MEQKRAHDNEYAKAKTQDAFLKNSPQESSPKKHKELSKQDLAGNAKGIFKVRMTFAYNMCRALTLREKCDWEIESVGHQMPGGKKKKDFPF